MVLIKYCSLTLKVKQLYCHYTLCTMKLRELSGKYSNFDNRTKERLRPNTRRPCCFHADEGKEFQDCWCFGPLEKLFFMSGCSLRKSETIFHIRLILIFFSFRRRQTTAVYPRQSVSSGVSAHNSGSAGLMRLCLLRVRQVFVAISKATPFKAAQL